MNQLVTLDRSQLVTATGGFDGGELANATGSTAKAWALGAARPACAIGQAVGSRLDAAATAAIAPTNSATIARGAYWGGRGACGYLGTVAGVAGVLGGIWGAGKNVYDQAQR